MTSSYYTVVYLYIKRGKKLKIGGQMTKTAYNKRFFFIANKGEG